MEKLFGPMEQMGFVVDNFDEPIKHWTEKLNVGPFFILEHLDLKDVYYYGKNGEENEIDFSVALAYSGNMQIEFIKQHCDTPSIYNEYVNNKKNTLHHLCTFTKNIENDIKILESQGYRNLQGGKTMDEGTFSYLDIDNNFSPILEIAQLSEGALGMFDMIKEASMNWDGKKPIMDLGEISI